ncbi:MAG: T9SS type A sorting domain-containing protein, partial [Ignavibacteria bacterium]|nr:T9SS type A sorting domain-containing protein [Ignavibacteria bacterium]
EIYNPLGQKIATLVNEFQNAGMHEVNWNAANNLSGSLQSGVYFARLKSGARIQTLKLILLK